MQRLLFWRCLNGGPSTAETLSAMKTGFNSHLQSNKLSTFCAKTHK